MHDFVYRDEFFLMHIFQVYDVSEWTQHPGGNVIFTTAGEDGRLKHKQALSPPFPLRTPFALSYHLRMTFFLWPREIPR
jgi:hypothetical protein